MNDELPDLPTDFVPGPDSRWCWTNPKLADLPPFTVTRTEVGGIGGGCVWYEYDNGLATTLRRGAPYPRRPEVGPRRLQVAPRRPAIGLRRLQMAPREDRCEEEGVMAPTTPPRCPACGKYQIAYVRCPVCGR